MLTAGYISQCNKSGESARARRPRILVLWMMGAYFSLSPAAAAQSSDSQSDGSNRSWTASSKSDNTNPTRTVQTHSESGNRRVDVQSLQNRQPDGSFQPYQDVETETVQVSATITRTTTSTFVRDGNGSKTLFQVTEEESHALPGGDSRVVRSTSNPDGNGKLQLSRREVQETRKSAPDVEETKTTVLLNINGELAPAMQIQERQKRSGDTVEIQKTTQLSDGAGSWQVSEVRQATIKDEGKNRSRDERVSRPDPEGKLGEVLRTVGKQSEDAAGQSRNSTETYSVDVPGVGRDNSLHLVRRVTTTEHTDSGSQQTIRQVEQPNPGDPAAGLRVSTVTTDTVHLGPSGAQGARTIQMRDGSGSLGVVSVDMTKSDNIHAIEVQIAPSKAK